MGVRTVIECDSCRNLIVAGDPASVITEGKFLGINADGDPLFEAAEEDTHYRCGDCTEAMKSGLDEVIATVAAARLDEMLDATADLGSDDGPQPGDEYSMEDEREREYPGPSGCCQSCDDLMRPMTATVNGMEVEVVDP